MAKRKHPGRIAAASINCNFPPLLRESLSARDAGRSPVKKTTVKQETK
jgi:hypothetical protein